MPGEIDPLKAYSEACNTLRHYSTASLQVRIASVVHHRLGALRAELRVSRGRSRRRPDSRAQGVDTGGALL